MAITRAIADARFELEFDLEPAAGAWARVAGDEGSARATYEGADYVLDLEERAGPSSTVVTFRLARRDRAEFTLRQYRLVARSALGDLHRIWIPHFTERHIVFNYMQRQLPMGALSPSQRYPLVDTRSCADSRSPIVLGLDRKGDVDFGVGLLDQRPETLMATRIATHYSEPDLERGRLRFEFARPIEGFVLGPIRELRDGFFVTRGAFWYDAMRAYREAHDAAMQRPVEPSPDPCWEPVWVPWVYKPGEWGFGRIEDVDDDLMLSAASIAADLGLATILNSGSYCFDSRHPGWAYPAQCGDYAADPEKFPDFRDTIRKLHAMGQRVCLWIDPFAVGKESRAREPLQSLLIPETNFLCPRNPDARLHMAELMTRLLRDYDADGYTVDCGGNVPLIHCTANHVHDHSSIGLALDDCYATMKRAMDGVKPDAIIEFSHNYSNINCLNYATAFRATDSGDTGDYELDRRLCVLLRSFVPPGKAVHVDPIWWRLDEDDRVVAKMLSTAIFSGVPQLGVDLINISDAHRELIRRWIGFYHAHKEDFRYGQMRPIRNDVEFSTVRVTCPGKAFVSFGNYPALRVPIPEDSREIYLFNCSLEDSLHTFLQGVSGAFGVEVYDHTLSVIGESRVDAAAGETLVDLGVPQGGVVVFKRI
jgi:alpha-galactosidase